MVSPVSFPVLTPDYQTSTLASGGFFSDDLAGFSSGKRWLLKRCLAGFVSGMRWLPQHRSWPAPLLTFIAHLRCWLMFRFGFSDLVFSFFQFFSWAFKDLLPLTFVLILSFLFRFVPVECSIRHPMVISEPVKLTSSLLLNHLVLFCLRQNTWLCAVSWRCVIYHLGFYGWAV